MKEKIKNFFEIDKSLTIIDKIVLFIVMLIMIPALLSMVIITYPLNLILKLISPLWKRRK